MDDVSFHGYFSYYGITIPLFSEKSIPELKKMLNIVCYRRRVCRFEAQAAWRRGIAGAGRGKKMNIRKGKQRIWTEKERFT
jgi:hypothetical protein